MAVGKLGEKEWRDLLEEFASIDTIISSTTTVRQKSRSADPHQTKDIRQSDPEAVSEYLLPLLEFLNTRQLPY